MYLIENKIILIHFPKCLGTKIKRHFDANNVRNMRHPGLKHLPKVYYRYPILGFIRNPFDFYVSFYHYFRNNKEKIPKSKLFRKYFNQSNPIDFEGNFEPVKEDFNKHLELLLTRGDEHDIDIKDHDVGLVSRLYQEIYESENSPDVRMFKFEELDLFNDYLEELHLTPIDEDKVNHTKHRHYSEYYTRESIELVKKYDAKILDKYNYSFTSHTIPNVSSSL